MWIHFIQGFFPIKHETRKRSFLSLYFPASSRCCSMKRLVMAQYKTTKTFPCIGLEEGKWASCLFWLYPPLGNLEKWVLCVSLDLTEARSLLKITSLAVVSNSISIAGPCFQPRYLVNTQFLDTLVSQVRWGHLEPWPHSLRIVDFWEVSTSSPSARVLKGPVKFWRVWPLPESPQAEPLRYALASWPTSTPEMAGFQWFSVYGAGRVPLDERQPNINWKCY